MNAAPSRWPPAAALTIGFLMVFIALPNPLKIPNNNPGATAELAPVPGDDEVDAPGNFGETGLATSNSLGSLDGGPPPPPPQGGREVPIDKECVEGRQTEDPLSPPCVPYFNGNNKGATWQGVTGEEVVIVFYNDTGVDGKNLNEPYDPNDEVGTTYETINLVRTMKAQLRYFQSKFQTYGRRVTIWATGGGTGSSEPQRRRDALRDKFKFEPFAVTYLGNNAGAYFAQMADYKVPSFGMNEDVSAQYYRNFAPYIWSFYPDQETESRWSATYICRRLLGRAPGETSGRLPAAYAPDPALKGKPRKLGLIYQKESQRGPEVEELAHLLMSELKSQCGYEFDKVKPFTGSTAAGASISASTMAEFKEADITTVLCYCIPVPTEVTVSTMMSAASSAEYYPEWYWDHMSRMDKPIWQQQYGNKRHFSFGTSYYWRQPAFREQMHYRAYQKATRDGSTPNVRWNFNIYYLYLNLFTAIQAAGPELTPETVQRGMFTFRFLKPSYPWLPTGSYGNEGPSPYTFIDTAMQWWWDPTGSPPGGKPGEGCQRVLNYGRRYYHDDWEVGDHDPALNDPSNVTAPCTEDRQRIADPQPGDF